MEAAVRGAMRQAILLFFVLHLLAGPVSAADIAKLEVNRKGDDYAVVFEAWIYAEPERVYAVLTDYDNWETLSPVVVASSVNRIQGLNRKRVHSELEGCVLFFCRRVTQVIDVEEDGERTITGTTVPEESDFSSGNHLWDLRRSGTRTRLRYRSTLRPNFWVPPLLGTWLIKRALTSHVEALANRIELLAHPEGEAYVM